MRKRILVRTLAMSLIFSTLLGLPGVSQAMAAADRPASSVDEILKIIGPSFADATKAVVALNEMIGEARRATVDGSGKPLAERLHDVSGWRASANRDLRALLDKAVVAGGLAYATIAGLQAALIGASGKLDMQDAAALESYFAMIQSYYAHKRALHVAAEVFGRAFPFQAKTLAALELILPSEIALKMVSTLGEKMKQAGGTAFDSLYRLADAGQGKKRLIAHPTEFTSYRMAALTALPEKTRAEDILEFVALKSIFAKIALLNNQLYNDEKVSAPLSKNADLALRNIKTHAEAFAAESRFRSWLTPQSLDGAVKAMWAKRDAKKFLSIVKVELASLAGKFPGKVNMELLNRYGGTTNSLAEVFLRLEQGQMTRVAHEILTSTPGYLSDQSRSELKDTLRQVIQEASRVLVGQAINYGLFNIEYLDKQEAQVVLQTVDKISAASFVEAAAAEGMVDDFIKMRDGSLEIATSFARYDLAQKAIKAAEEYGKLQETVERLQYVKDGEKVPLSLISDSPDPGAVLLAKVYDLEKVPLWFTQVLQSIGSLTRESTASSRKLLDGLQEFPLRLLDLAEDARKGFRSNPGLGAMLKRTHARLMKKSEYRWASIELQMNMVAKAVPSEGTREVVLALLKMLALADTVKADALRDYVQNIFHLISDGNHNAGAISAELKKAFLDKPKEGIDYFIEDIKKCVDFLSGKNRVFIQSVFSPRGDERDLALRRELQDRKVFTNYITLKLQILEATMPIVFHKVQLWQGGRDQSQNKEPIVFGDLILGLKKAVKAAGLGDALAKPAIDYVKAEMIDTKRLRHDQASLALPVKLSAQTTQLVVNAERSQLSPRYGALFATMKLKKQDEMWRTVMDSVLAAVMDGPSVPPMEDSYWPEEYKVRDVLPAVYDPSSSYKMKALRIMVSALLSPYIKSAAVASATEQKLLMKDGVDIKTLVKTGAYKMAMAELGDSVAGGFERMHDEATESARFWQDVKKITAKTSMLLHYTFYASFLIRFTPAGNALLAHFMFFNSLVDRSSDIVLFKDYWDSYSGLRPYSFSGAMDQSLVKAAEIDRMKEEIYFRGWALANSLPFDLWFARDMLSSYSQVLRDSR